MNREAIENAQTYTLQGNTMANNAAQTGNRKKIVKLAHHEINKPTKNILSAGLGCVCKE
jgi:hypothetical protein